MKLFSPISILALGSLLLASPPSPAQDAPPPRCEWRLIVAVPEEGNTMIAFNGSTVAPNGYPGGFSSGGIGSGSGAMRLNIEHPPLETKTSSISLKGGQMNTILIHVVEKKVKDKVIRQLEATNLAAPLKGSSKPQILVTSISQRQAVSFEVDGKSTSVLSGASKALKLSSGGEKEITLGETGTTVEVVSGKAAPVLVIYDGIDGKPRVAAAD